MEKGYFQSSLDNGYSINNELNQEVKTIPTPNKLPQKPNPKDIPLSALKSGAIESLMEQNDDLMARLNISLRRIALLEEEINSVQNEANENHKKYENLKDQVLIIKAKAQAISQREDSRNEKEESLKSKILFLETAYNEVFNEKETLEKGYIEIESKLQKLLAREKKYSNSLKEVAKKLRFSLHESNNTNLELSKNISFQERKINDLRNNLEKSTEYIKKQSKEQQEKIEQLTQGYEQTIERIESTLNERNTQLTTLEGRDRELTQLQDKYIKLENQIIFEQRKHEEYRIKTQAEVADLTSNFQRHKKELHAQALENQEHKKNLKEQRLKINEQHSKINKLQEQVESLQALWHDSQMQLEKNIEKNKALQALNQKISINLNQSKKDNNDLRQKLDKLHFCTTSDLKTIRKKVNTLSEIKSTAPNHNPEEHSNLLDKIDSLLTEIHTGYEPQNEQE